MEGGKTAAAAQPSEADDKKVLDEHRRRDFEGGQLNVPKPKHGDPTELAPPGQGESVLGVRVGSEAAVESGLGPVLPAQGAPLGELTRVRNKDLRERDEKEFRKRGVRKGNTMPAGVAISASFEGVMMIEREEDDGGDQLVSGSFSGVIPEGGLRIRPLTPEEEQEHFGTGTGPQNQRANDLVKGSGVGGGGNPMHAGDTRGTSSRTAERSGQGGVTSKAGAAPPPQGGGISTKDR